MQTNNTEKQLSAISEWLSNVKFKKNIMGGLDEADVWKKIQELNDLYEKLIYSIQNQSIDSEDLQNNDEK